MRRFKGKIKNRIVRAALYSRTLTHIRHYRGYGVHSPFVYGVIRNAIMKHSPEGNPSALYDELRTRGFSKRRAAQLQNLYSVEGYTSYSFADATYTPASLGGRSICFVTVDFPESQMATLTAEATRAGSTLCLLSPHISRRRNKMAKSLVASHRHTSIDNRGFLLLFFNPRLPKQHFNL